MRPTYAAFPESEHRERLARARKILRQNGIDCCVSVAPEHLYYLAGYDSWVSVNSPQALVFMADGGEPALVVRDVDLALPRETSWVSDVRSYHLFSDDVPALIAAVAREKGLAGGKVAIETQSYALPHALGQSVARALAPATVVDATDLLGATRLIKSAREIAYLREAAKYALAGLDAARRTLEPGITEIALAAAVEGGMRGAGSDYWSIPTELASGPRTAGGHATARDRVIESGDLVHLEFAGVHRRYHAAAIHTFAVGQPSRRAREIYDLGRASLAAGIAAIRPGVPVADVEEASLEPLRTAGLEAAAIMRFGYGIGIAYPPIWLEPLQISRGIDQRLEPGMVFVLHAYLQLLEEGLGIIQGGTYALTENGLEMLVGGGDVGLEIV
ncbi:MAG TPA: Xaa-Pro peptidase family protein [Acetobacteraceae bacterium]|jgi:Xaa-Pro dipeptidase|nr:Xaa-Pro peptidase family protein [Acetobacteraceae bacterium]